MTGCDEATQKRYQLNRIVSKLAALRRFLRKIGRFWKTLKIRRLMFVGEHRKFWKLKRNSNLNFDVKFNDEMSSLEADRSLSPMGVSPIPEGLILPPIIITRRTRTLSMNGRIEDEVHEGTVKFFCRSRGHGFIDDSMVNTWLFSRILTVFNIVFLSDFYCLTGIQIVIFLTVPLSYDILKALTLSMSAKKSIFNKDWIHVKECQLFVFTKMVTTALHFSSILCAFEHCTALQL